MLSSSIRRYKSLFLVSAGFSFGPALVAAQELPPSPTAPSQAANLELRPGDSVRLTVWRVPELDGEFIVAPDGTLAHPAFPSLNVAGTPLWRVQGMLDSAARIENVNARVVMQPLLRIIVGGEVGAPNLYRHPAGTSIAEAIVLAGGPTEQARVDRIALVRDGATTYLDLTDPAGPTTRAPVRSGDQLLMPRRSSSFYETVLPFISVLGTAASIATLILRTRR